MIYGTTVVERHAKYLIDFVGQGDLSAITWVQGYQSRYYMALDANTHRLVYLGPEMGEALQAHLKFEFELRPLMFDEQGRYMPGLSQGLLKDLVYACWVQYADEEVQEMWDDLVFFDIFDRRGGTVHVTFSTPVHPSLDADGDCEFRLRRSTVICTVDTREKRVKFIEVPPGDGVRGGINRAVAGPICAEHGFALED